MRELHYKVTCLISESSINQKLHHSRILELLLTFQPHSKDLHVTCRIAESSWEIAFGAEFGVSEPTLLFCSAGVGLELVTEYRAWTNCECEEGTPDWDW